MTNTKTEALIGRCTDCGKEYNQRKHFLCPCVKTEALQRAIDYLGAREVAPGRYAWRFKNAESAWYVSIAEDLANGYDTLALLKRPATRKMKPWWSPDRQYAIRRGELPDSILVRMAHPDDCNSPYPAYKVTCDLESGEEIPA